MNDIQNDIQKFIAETITEVKELKAREDKNLELAQRIVVTIADNFYPERSIPMKNNLKDVLGQIEILISDFIEMDEKSYIDAQKALAKNIKDYIDRVVGE